MSRLGKFNIWRTAIQVLYFIFLPGAFTAAFHGVKYLFTQIGSGQQIEMTSFVKALATLCVFTIVFGRFFCGFACAFGSLGDAVHALYRWICVKCKKKPARIPQKVRSFLSAGKYLILAGIAVLCFLGVYGQLRGTSPWDVFSTIHARRFQLEGYAIGGILLLLILVGMAVEERFFCRFLCPLGAVFSLLPILPFFQLVRNRKECIPGCRACSTRCPSELALPAEHEYPIMGECFQCQKCIGTCAKSNIHCTIRSIRGDEWWFALLRAGLLLGSMIWLGI